MTIPLPPVAAAHQALRAKGREREPLTRLAEWVETHSKTYGSLFLSDTYGLPLNQTGESCSTNDEKIATLIRLLKEAAGEHGVFNQSERDYLGRVLRVWSEHQAARLS